MSTSDRLCATQDIKYISFTNSHHKEILYRVNIEKNVTCCKCINTIVCDL
jgi:hypothetical protein